MNAILRKISSMYWRRVYSKITPLLSRSASFGAGTVLYGVPEIVSAHPGHITFGKRCVLTSLSPYTALGVKQRCRFNLLSDRAIIRIGDDVGLSGVVICAENSVMIGANCLLGSGVAIFDTDFHQLSPANRRYAPIPPGKPVVLGANVFVGTNTLICKGVTIGDNSVIGAGSVVVKSIPANVIAAGNPCIVIRENN
ncbi:MAG: DapH/DapD/GlmU-related protein [Gammaproteobacteria bacterium]